MKKKIIFPCAAAAAVMAMIFIFSSKEVGISLGQSSQVTRWVCRLIFFRFGEMTAEQQTFLVTELDFFIRKLAHFSVYMLLGIFTYAAALGSGRLRYKGTAALLICALYAALDEVHQHFVPGRSMRLTDVCIDSLGALLGIFILRTAILLIKEKFKKCK